MRLMATAAIPTLLYNSVAQASRSASFFYHNCVDSGQSRSKTSTAWAVFFETNPRECWSVSSPTKMVTVKDGKSVREKRSGSLLMTTFRPNKKVSGQSGYTGGYQFKKGSTVKVVVGDRKFQFNTSGEWAWPVSAAAYVKVRRAFQKGRYVTIEGKSSGGMSSKDTFSLTGYSAATNDAENRCGEP